MSPAVSTLTEFLVAQVSAIQRRLRGDSAAHVAPDSRFADLLDSMGMVELLGVVAEECGVTPIDLEECADRRFGKIEELALAMAAAGYSPSQPASDDKRVQEADSRGGLGVRDAAVATVWLGGITARLPVCFQRNAELDALLGRPSGWLVQHAGIQSRCVWNNQDPLDAACSAATQAMDACGVVANQIDALLVTSEAPPMLAGLAAALHHRLGLPVGAIALEIGGACTGFLASLWLARELLQRADCVLILTLEAPSRYLEVKPGPAGEAAALFGDGAAAALVTRKPLFGSGVLLRHVALAYQGEWNALLRVEHGPQSAVQLQMNGPALAARAIRAMTQAARELARGHGLSLIDLQAVVVHGGNGRMPALIARGLGLPVERVWSRTCETGNLGSVSLPAAWAAHGQAAPGPVVWTAVGAGLTAGAALTGPCNDFSGMSGSI